MIDSIDLMPFTDEKAKLYLDEVNSLFCENNQNWDDVLKNAQYYIVNLILWHNLMGKWKDEKDESET